MSDVLPRGWVRVALNEIFQPRSDRVLPSSVPEARYIGLEHVEAHTNKILGTSQAGVMSSSAARFFDGDVLYGRMRPYLNKVVVPTFDGVASAEFIVFPKIEGVDNKFIRWRLSAADFVGFACGQYEGDRPRVKFDQMGKFEILFPPSVEQERIVAKLEEILSELDSGIAELKAAQKKLALYRQSLLKAAVEGALTAEWRQRNTVQESGEELLRRILGARRARWEAEQIAKYGGQGKTPPKNWENKYAEAVESDVADLPSLPQGWVWASLDALIAEGPQNGLYLPAERYGKGVPILRINDYQIGWCRERDKLNQVDADADQLRVYALSVNDVVMNRVNSMTHLGKSLVVPASLSGAVFESNMMRIRLAEGANAQYVCAYLGSSVGRRRLIKNAKWAVNQASINQQDVRATPIPLPPLEEQEALMDLLLTQIDGVQSQEDAILNSLKQAAAQRQNILRAAFSGQLVAQDPGDEPAGVLLERIRAERAAGQPARTRGRKPRVVKDAA